MQRELSHSYALNRKLQLKIIEEIDGKVYCKIAKKEISPEQCLDVQGQAGCFGCAAPSRLCDNCKVRPILFPEIELCGNCLTRELELEEKTTIPDFPKTTKVACPLASNKKIAAQTCRNMQSAQCGACDAPSRICVECESKPVRYPEYGMCLGCTVEAYGDMERENEKLVFFDTADIDGEKETSSELDAPFPNRLREIRIKNGLNLITMDILIFGTCNSGYSSLEKGFRLPCLRTALKIETILDCPISYFYPSLKNEAKLETQKREEDIDVHTKKRKKWFRESYNYKKNMENVGRKLLNNDPELFSRVLDVMATLEQVTVKPIQKALYPISISERSIQGIQRLLETVGAIGYMEQRRLPALRKIHLNLSNLPEVKRKFGLSNPDEVSNFHDPRPSVDHSSILSNTFIQYEKRAQEMLENEKEFLSRAIDVIAESQKCGSHYLRRELKITSTTATVLQYCLVKKGVIQDITGQMKKRVIYVTSYNRDEIKKKLGLVQ